MASITARGFCELAVLSRYTSGFPCTCRSRIGKSLRISSGVRITLCVPVVLSDVSIFNLISLKKEVSPHVLCMHSTCGDTSLLIFGQLNLFLNLCTIQFDRFFVYPFDLPAFLGIDPHIGLGLVGTTHTPHNTTP